MPFLKNIAKIIIDNNHDLSNCRIILPTRRSAAHLKTEMSALLTKTSWLPEFMTINEWIDRITGLEPADNLTLKFACYEAYIEVMQRDARDISDFFSWADILISDFNDIEAQRIDKKSFFRNLSDYREIEQFSFLSSPLTEKQERYKKFWSALPKIHDRFNTILLKSNKAYTGLNLRKAHEIVSDPEFAFDKKLFVVGLNAFSKSERDILKLFQDRGGAEIFYDTDDYYITQRENHAGHFIRQNLKNQLGKSIPTAVSMVQKEMKVEICEAAHHIDQAVVVGGLLSELTLDERKKTALVLADESMLIPILDNLPKDFDDFNITMGIGLTDSLFVSWFDALYEVVFRKSRKNGKDSLPANGIAAFLTHSFSALLQKNPETTTWKKYGYITPEELEDQINPNKVEWISRTIEFWTADESTRNDTLNQLLLSVNEILDHIEKQTIANLQAQKAISLISRGLKQLDKFEKHIQLSDAQHYQIANRMIAGGSIDLLSEPHDRLQIMGILETRALAFNRIIVCGANEGLWPAKVKMDSFIPFEIRNFHHLPGKKEKEAVYAYNFYRLFSHAQAVQLVYHTDRGAFSGGEKSRYLLQIEYILKNENPALNLEYRFSEQVQATNQNVEYVVEKNQEIIDLIKAHLKRGLSISSINQFLADSLAWYYSFVVAVRPPEEDEMDAASFGIVVHEVLQNLFTPTINVILTEDMIHLMEAEVDEEIKKAIPERLLAQNIETGINRLHFETAKAQIKKYLASLRKKINQGETITCLAVEESLNNTLNVTTTKGTYEVNFKGFADKVLRRNGKMEIIDYKTGNVAEKDLKFKEFSIEALEKTPKAVQLLTYNWMAAAKFKTENEIDSRIVTLRAPERTKLNIEYRRNDLEATEKFENFLKQVITDMLNPDIPLRKNPDFKYSKFE